MAEPERLGSFLSSQPSPFTERTGGSVTGSFDCLALAPEANTGWLLVLNGSSYSAVGFLSRRGSFVVGTLASVYKAQEHKTRSQPPPAAIGTAASGSAVRAESSASPA